jgi:hypothetical protein
LAEVKGNIYRNLYYESILFKGLFQLTNDMETMWKRKSFVTAGRPYQRYDFIFVPGPFFDRDSMRYLLKVHWNSLERSSEDSIILGNPDISRDLMFPIQDLRVSHVDLCGFPINDQ